MIYFTYDTYCTFWEKEGDPTSTDNMKRNPGWSFWENDRCFKPTSFKAGEKLGQGEFNGKTWWKRGEWPQSSKP